MPSPALPLTPEQEAHLTALTTRDTGAVKTYRRAQALLALHQGGSYAAVAAQQRVR
jgi:hypothetical protein